MAGDHSRGELGRPAQFASAIWNVIGWTRTVQFVLHHTLRPSPQAPLVSPLQNVGVTSRVGAQKIWMRFDAHPAEVETVGVPARENRDVPNGKTIAMPPARGHKTLKIGCVEFEDLARQSLREQCCAWPMLWIMTIVQAF